MLAVKDILRGPDGQPLLVELIATHENTRIPSELWGLQINLSEDMEERLLAEARKQAVDFGRSLGIDEAEIQERIDEKMENVELACLACEPFELCWN